MTSCSKLQNQALNSIVKLDGGKTATPVVWNTLGWERTEVIKLNGDAEKSPAQKKSKTSDNHVEQIDSFGDTLGM